MCIKRLKQNQKEEQRSYDFMTFERGHLTGLDHIALFHQTSIQGPVTNLAFHQLSVPLITTK